MKKIVIALVMLAFMASCGNRYVIDPETLEDVLVDIHLAEGMLLQNSHDFASQQQKVDLFSAVYEKYGIDKARFDSTLVYYSDDPTVLSDVYEKVTARLKVLAQQVNDGDYALSKRERSADVFKQIMSEDIALLPMVVDERWDGVENYDFKAKKFLPLAQYIPVDSVLGTKMVLRFSLRSDSLLSAKCVVRTIGEQYNDENEFNIPIGNDGMQELTWGLKEDMDTLQLIFSAEGMNDNAACELSAFRLYSISDEKRDIALF